MSFTKLRQELIDGVTDFPNQINAWSLALSDRLWVKMHLEPEKETKMKFD